MSDLTKNKFLKRHQHSLVSSWQKELLHSPDFEHDSEQRKEKLAEHAEHYLEQLVSVLETETIPRFSLRAHEPAIKFWHQLFKEHLESGLTTQDMAKLLFTLKSSVMSVAKQASEADNYDYAPDLDELQSLLDFIGLITFEIYRVENEAIISRQQEHIRYLQDKNQRDYQGIIANSPAIQEVLKTIELVVDNDVTILLEGESGTGKDVIANLIHSQSKRKNRPFIAVNCGAIPRELIESELFGHEKGAFTGADSQHIGKFELAQGGTLFLDEIGELPIDLQVKLLRVLQNRDITRVGGRQKIKVDARIIAATNRSLKQLVDEKLFRLDLYYRLNVFPILMPPLRDRKEDIMPLTQHFSEKYAQLFELEEPIFTASARAYLENHPWEGNIRELENLVQRSVLLAQGGQITADLLDLTPGQRPAFLDQDSIKQLPAPLTEVDSTILTLEEVEKQAIEQVLDHTQRNMAQSAKLLGISRTTLYNKIDKYNLQ